MDLLSKGDLQIFNENKMKTNKNVSTIKHSGHLTNDKNRNVGIRAHTFQKNKSLLEVIIVSKRLGKQQMEKFIHAPASEILLKDGIFIVHPSYPTVQFSNHFIPDLTRLASLMTA